MNTIGHRSPRHLQITVLFIVSASVSFGVHAGQDPSETSIDATGALDALAAGHAPGQQHNNQVSKGDDRYVRPKQQAASLQEKSARPGKVLVETSAHVEATEQKLASNRADQSQMVYIDPATGKFTSSPPMAEQLYPLMLADHELNTSFDDLEIIEHADGSFSVDLQGRFQSHVYVTIDDNGNMAVSHQEEPQALPAPAQATPHSSDKE